MRSSGTPGSAMDGITTSRHKWTGTFGQNPLEMEITVANSQINGKVKTQKNGPPIPFEGTANEEGLFEVQFQTSEAFVMMHGKVFSAKKSIEGNYEELGESEKKGNFQIKLSEISFKRTLLFFLLFLSNNTFH